MAAFETAVLRHSAAHMQTPGLRNHSPVPAKHWVPMTPTRRRRLQLPGAEGAVNEGLEITPEIARPAFTAGPRPWRGSASSRGAVLHTRPRPGPSSSRTTSCQVVSPQRGLLHQCFQQVSPQRVPCFITSAGPTLTASSPSQALLRGLVRQGETGSPSATCPRALSTVCSVCH